MEINEQTLLIVNVVLRVANEFVEFYGVAREDGFGIFYPPRRVIVGP